MQVSEHTSGEPSVSRSDQTLGESWCSHEEEPDTVYFAHCGEDLWFLAKDTKATLQRDRVRVHVIGGNTFWLVLLVHPMGQGFSFSLIYTILFLGAFHWAGVKEPASRGFLSFQNNFTQMYFSPNCQPIIIKQNISLPPPPTVVPCLTSWFILAG